MSPIPAGAVCAAQPAAGQIPALREGADPKGCNYTDSKQDPLALDVYNEHKNQTVKFYGDGPGKLLYEGSGVMVGKSGDQCKILTALHVIESDTPGEKICQI